MDLTGSVGDGRPWPGARHRRSHACPLGAVADLQLVSRSAAAEIFGRHLHRGLLGRRPVGWPGRGRTATPTHETFEKVESLLSERSCANVARYALGLTRQLH